MTRILAIDGAATAGFCFGATGEEPRFGSRCFTGGGASGEVVRGSSAPCALSSSATSPTSSPTRRVFPGRGFCKPPGQREDAGGCSASAETHRRHRLGLQSALLPGDRRRSLLVPDRQSNWGGRARKAATIAAARARGWAVNDDNAADACAVWAYAESILDPVAAQQRRARSRLSWRCIPQRRHPAMRSRGAPVVNHKTKGDKVMLQNQIRPLPANCNSPPADFSLVEIEAARGRKSPAEHVSVPVRRVLARTLALPRPDVGTANERRHLQFEARVGCAVALRAAMNARDSGDRR